MKRERVLTVPLLILALLIAGCATQKGSAVKSDYVAGEADFTLQLLHFADIDGNEEIALGAVDEFSALINGFKADREYGTATLVVSSGDNIIPGPRFYASEQKPVRKVTGSNEPGHVDIAFLNAFGVVASALGNHDLDAGPGELADAMQEESKDGVEFPGAQFPYLAANIDFSTDKDTAEIIGDNGANVMDLKGKMAAYAVAEVNGSKIGLVGASTPSLNTITSVGGLVIKPEKLDAVALAKEIQPSIDALEAMGINKVVLLTHMQQIQIEKDLAKQLRGVDIIVAGGSNTRMGDSTDTLFDSDDAFDENYPYQTADSAGKPILIVNVDGDYKYLGRLVVSFDAAGYVITDSIDETVSGAWASTAQNVAMVGGTPSDKVVAVRDAVTDVITAQYGNVLGYTDVYLDGRRSQVRTQETNLGSLTADANLWYANLMSKEPVHISIKNGGGLRTEIGSAVVPPGSVDYSEAILSPPLANMEAGTDEGAITEGHLRATLRFDNGLLTMTATAKEFVGIMEHAVSATGGGATPGQFPQVSGLKIKFDVNKEPGARIQTLEVLNEDGSVLDTVVSGGAFQGDPSRTFRLVTLNFLANGGDDYPFTELSEPNRRNMYEGTGYGEETDYDDEVLTNDPGMNSDFSYTGGEQDALAEYLKAFHPTKDRAFAVEETDMSGDMRIQY